MIEVEVVYAEAAVQRLYSLRLEQGATIEDAVRESGLLAAFPQLDLGQCRIGIYGRLKVLDTPLKTGDRVEIYRALIADPKETRRKRAIKP